MFRAANVIRCFGCLSANSICMSVQTFSDDMQTNLLGMTEAVTYERQLYCTRCQNDLFSFCFLFIENVLLNTSNCYNKQLKQMFGIPSTFFQFFFLVFEFHTFFPSIFPFQQACNDFLRMNKIQNNDNKKVNRTNDNIKRPLKKNKNLTNQYQKHKGKEKCFFAHFRSKIFYF